MVIAAILSGILAGTVGWAGESNPPRAVNGSAVKSASNRAALAAEPGNALAAHFLCPSASARPWVWWWWPGCAVTKPDITANLEAMARSGIGGVNIIGILDVKDVGAKRLPYLSPEWTEHLVWAIHEARRLGMDADTSPVPGWAFGGRWVKPEESAAVFEASFWQAGVIKVPVSRLLGRSKDPAPGKSKSLQLTCLINGQEQTFIGTEGKDIEIHAKPEQVRVMKALSGVLPDGPTLDLTTTAGTLIATSTLAETDIPSLNVLMMKTAQGEWIDLTAEIRQGGWAKVADSAPAGASYYAVLTRRGSSSSRMPPPGAGGPVIDHLSKTAVQSYFSKFDEAFKGLGPADLPRAYNNDSWEIRLNWTPGLFDEFSRRRGYDLRQHLDAFMGQGPADVVNRVACDYQQTVSDLMVDVFTTTFRDWAHGHGGKIIGEPIDEPGHELDINALYDIPQADICGPRAWWLKQGDYVPNHFFRRAKISASAAHLLGKPLISSEAMTCIGPQLDVPFELLKEKIDADLVFGVNQSMFHGICYSPVAARWPGWLFYAETHLGPFNPMWRQGKAFFDYTTRCQAVLQSGRPDADLLVYFPVFDHWSRRGSAQAAGVWGLESAGPKTAEALWRAGHDFDFVSDRLLESVQFKNGQLAAPGAQYKALVVADVDLLPETTLARIVELAKSGGTVILPGRLPSDVPGLGALEQRRVLFKKSLAVIEAAKAAADQSGVARVGQGRIIFAGTVLDAMRASGIQREAMMDQGLRYIRRQDDQGTIYFITNLAEGKRVDGWVGLAAKGECAAIFDAMSGRMGMAGFRQNTHGATEVRLQLDPRESCIVRVFNRKVQAPAWTYLEPTGEPLDLAGSWEVQFIEGGEILPKPEKIMALSSWTEWKSEQSPALRGFSGVASYRIHFQKPKQQADEWAVDLGTVYHTARVTLNGRKLGDLFSRPMRVLAGTALKKGDNVLEIEVANAPINRAADLDLRGVEWQKTKGEGGGWGIGDFLFKWQKKDASWIPRPSGLIGPVRLVPLTRQP